MDAMWYETDSRYQRILDAGGHLLSVEGEWVASAPEPGYPSGVWMAYPDYRECYYELVWCVLRAPGVYRAIIHDGPQPSLFACDLATKSSPKNRSIKHLLTKI